MYLFVNVQAFHWGHETARRAIGKSSMAEDVVDVDGKGQKLDSSIYWVAWGLSISDLHISLQCSEDFGFLLSMASANQKGHETYKTNASFQRPLFLPINKIRTEDCDVCLLPQHLGSRAAWVSCEFRPAWSTQQAPGSRTAPRHHLKTKQPQTNTSVLFFFSSSNSTLVLETLTLSLSLWCWRSSHVSINHYLVALRFILPFLFKNINSFIYRRLGDSSVWFLSFFSCSCRLDSDGKTVIGR